MYNPDQFFAAEQARRAELYREAEERRMHEPGQGNVIRWFAWLASRLRSRPAVAADELAPLPQR